MDAIKPKVMVVSHERSGTHFLMNTIALNFDYISAPWINLDWETTYQVRVVQTPGGIKLVGSAEKLTKCSCDGFCTVNGLVVAASAHLERHPDDRVVIVDVDAHCGGGTAACLASAGLTDRVQHLDIYTSSFDLYRPVGPDDVLARGGDTDEEYLSDVAILLSSIDWEQADLVLYNAGMDPHPGISAEALAHRERLMFEQAAANNTPVAWVLAGGYTWGITMDELVDLHLLTARAAAIGK